ncbi:MAG: folate-binding protein YgfZ [Hyphomicrobiales bacterium]|nr:folate-binding protein YgfZ [Hyphomicrobiales bacterium]MCP5372528.1 folate-binding protein YgfZ [Hyphomicrobiales bacterium]
MTETRYAILPDRGVLTIAGEEHRAFLQGLISNDVNRVDPGHAAWAAFLTPQGKYLHDFFLAPHGDGLLLDGEAARLPDLLRRLKMYRLRSKVDLADLGDVWAVAALFGDGAAAAAGLDGTVAGAAAPFAGGVAFVDPRLAAAGVRAILPRDGAEAALAGAGLAAASAADYDAHRLALGLPDGSRDLELEKSILLESGFDELHGVDWNKGCYMGQELTARTKYRGLIKKRLLPVTIDGPAPEPGTPILAGGREAGEMRSSAGDRGLALLRLEFLDPDSATGDLSAGGATLHPWKPEWLDLATGRDSQT